jgi:hypothetical protein
MTKRFVLDFVGGRRSSAFLKLGAVLLLAVLSSVAALAQLAGKGAVSGTVLDPTGAVVPGATVVIKSTTTGVVTKTVSTSAGDYVVSTLDPGVYTVTVTAAGFEKLVQENVHVNALETVSLSPKLTVGATDTSVTVSTQPPALETTNATLGGTMEQEMYAALPIQMGAYGQADQRRATDFAFLMPGVQANNTSGNPTTNTGVVNGSGSKGGVTAVYIDGIPFVRAGGNGDPRFVWTAISVDAVNQFQVQTSGYSAIYEGQGIQNYTIKQGAEKYHGSIYEFFRNTALDTWGFFGANITNPATGQPIKPIEHQNEYGINLSGPVIPFGSLRDKIFFFGNYNGYRYSHVAPTAITFPTLAEQQGNFQALTTLLNPGNPSIPTTGIYDPFTQASCTANSSTGPCRYRYGYIPGTGAGAAGNPVLGPLGQAGVDVIPASELSAVAKQTQTFLPALANQQIQNNYYAPNATKLSNWSTSDRIDVTLGRRDQLSMVGAIGRQASNNPVGQSTAGRNVGPPPYNYGQAYAPKTAVGIIEETHTFSPRIVNQIKYGYARYNGPTFSSNQQPAFAATTQGLTGLPAGQAQNTFPIVTFAGSNVPTNWGGTTANVVLAENYTLLDNVEYVIGKHNITAGAQIAWLLYNSIPATGSSTPLTIANAVTETAAITPSTNAAPKYAATANTGLSYASYLIGQIDKGSLTQYVVQEFGSRFRAISPYVQDNWKVSRKLTLDLGVRWDYFPTLEEAHDNVSFFNPNLVNPITGHNGGLQFTGTGAGTCNCRTPINNYFKNIGPRLGLAYSVDDKTVIRASYGIMFTHGNGVGGGGASVTGGSANSLGFSAAPSFSASGTLLSTFPLTGTNNAFPAFTAASGRASGPAYGTGYTTTTGYTGTPSGMGYADPYLGGRAPEYVNWSLGFQHQWTNAFTSTITYVGSQGHFLSADGSNARGYYADQLDPQYLSLGSGLSTLCSASTLCPTGFTGSQSVGTALKPFPFQSVSDPYGNVSNSNYHALQSTFQMRASHGVQFMANYTWSRAIDDAGTFRSGYAIPAAYSGRGIAYKADAIERSVSNSSQPHHAVVTGVWNLPFGKSIMNSNYVERAVLGGFQFSTIFQAYSGSPLAITAASCGTNPAQGTCMPTYNPAYTKNQARINGKHWGQGVTRTTISSISYIDSTAFTTTGAYVFGNTARTAPYGLTGPGNYDLDIALVRTFPLHFESMKLNMRAELYNVTNHTQFSVASAVYGNSTFGQVAGTQANNSRSAQLSARLEF